jgi:hypothetical protein
VILISSPDFIPPVSRVNFNLLIWVSPLFAIFVISYVEFDKGS